MHGDEVELTYIQYPLAANAGEQCHMYQLAVWNHPLLNFGRCFSSQCVITVYTGETMVLSLVYWEYLFN